MTLADRREPTFHAVKRDGDGAHASVPALTHTAGPHGGAAPARPTGFGRFVSSIQILGTLIGVPLALASGYSLYRTNFAAETACLNLRASIVSMLDKNVDPATRRMLVKRDITAFEKNCGAVDPDAHAAFTALLADEKPVAARAPAAKAPVSVQAAVPTPAPQVAPAATAKVEQRPVVVEKKQVAAPAPETDSAQRDDGMSDTRWLDAVREALVDHQPATKVSTPAAKPLELAAPPTVLKPPRAEPVVTAKPGDPVLQPNWSVAPASAAAAPLLPPPSDIAENAGPPAKSDRPVPPASIPSAQVHDSGSWIAQIPFVGRVLDQAGN